MQTVKGAQDKGGSAASEARETGPGCGPPCGDGRGWGWVGGEDSIRAINDNGKNTIKNLKKRGKSNNN